MFPAFSRNTTTTRNNSFRNSDLPEIQKRIDFKAKYRCPTMLKTSANIVESAKLKKSSYVGYGVFSFKSKTEK